MVETGKRIAIIGAGFSGSLLAVQLLRRCGTADQILLIEKNEQFGRGLAYSTGNPGHLLNVRAGNMSAFSDQPDHFLAWLKTLRPETTSTIPATIDSLTFVPRSLYGSYIQSLLGEEIWGQGRGRNLSLIADEVVSVRRHSAGLRIEVACGRHYAVDIAVLAVGNFPPDDNPSDRYFGDPWDPKALDGLEPTLPVLLIGTGLTMVDTVLSLLDQEHTGPIHAISRRGLLPRTHAASRPYRRFLAGATPRSIVDLLRAVRREIHVAASQGIDWRSVIDAIRPDTQTLWQTLPIEEKRRFLRHLRPWWDVHRHRMAPEVAARIETALRTGRLLIHCGRVQSLEADRQGITAQLQLRGEDRPLPLRVARVINCSGPQSDYGRIAHPLIRNLLATGLARPDPLGLGLAVTSDNALIGGDGAVSNRLFAIGPVTKGTFWETTSVPDIRTQCEQLADHLIGPFAASSRAFA